MRMAISEINFLRVVFMPKYPEINTKQLTEHIHNAFRKYVIGISGAEIIIG